MNEIINGDIILGKAKMSDLESIYNNYWSDAETAKYMLWKVCDSVDEAKERLEKSIQFQSKGPSFFVYLKGVAIGMAGLKEIQDGVYEDCGIGIGSKFVGKGIGTKIISMLLDYAFNDLKAEKVVTSADELNSASNNLQIKMGLKFTHKENQVRKRDGQKYVANYYEITKDDYFKLVNKNQIN